MSLTDAPRQQLLRLPLLARASPAARRALAGACDLLRFADGDTIIARGAEEHDLLIVLDGRARVVVDGLVVAALGPGDMVGEMGFFERFPARSADVLAQGFCALAVLRREAYAALPPAASAALELAVLGALAGRLAETNAQISALLDAQPPSSRLHRLRRWLAGRGRR